MSTHLLHGRRTRQRLLRRLAHQHGERLRRRRLRTVPVAPVRYDLMRAALEQTSSFAELKNIRDMAMALEAHAKASGGDQRRAAEMRVRAERRLGQMLKQM